MRGPGKKNAASSKGAANSTESVNGNALPRVRKVVQVMLFGVLQDRIWMKNGRKCSAPIDDEVQVVAIIVTEPEKVGIAGETHGWNNLSEKLVGQ